MNAFRTLSDITAWSGIDVFDYLDKNSAKKLAEQLTRVLKPDGVLLAFFVTAEPQPGAKPEYTRYVVIDETHLQHRLYPAARGKQRPMPNRDIQRMFEELRVTEQFLLKSNLRESKQPFLDESASVYRRRAQRGNTKRSAMQSQDMESLLEFPVDAFFSGLGQLGQRDA